MAKQLRIERLSNGLIAVYDYASQWQAIYNTDGTYRHSAVDCPEYRAAVRAFISKRQG